MADICTIYDVGTQDGEAFIAMEFLEGTTLKHRIARRPLANWVIVTIIFPRRFRKTKKG